MGLRKDYLTLNIDVIRYGPVVVQKIAISGPKSDVISAFNILIGMAKDYKEVNNL